MPASSSATPGSEPASPGRHSARAASYPTAASSFPAPSAPRPETPASPSPMAACDPAQGGSYPTAASSLSGVSASYPGTSASYSPTAACDPASAASFSPTAAPDLTSAASYPKAAFSNPASPASYSPMGAPHSPTAGFDPTSSASYPTAASSDPAAASSFPASPVSYPVSADSRPWTAASGPAMDAFDPAAAPHPPAASGPATDASDPAVDPYRSATASDPAEGASDPAAAPRPAPAAFDPVMADAFFDVPAPAPDAPAISRTESRPDLLLTWSGGVVREVSVPPLAEPVHHGSLADIPFVNAAEAPDEPVIARRTGGGQWDQVRADQFAREVLDVAKGLIAQGLQPGDRVAVMARTTYEWTLLDFAAWAAGLVTVPIYPTSAPALARWLLEDSGAVALAVETSDLAAVLGPELRRLPELRHVWMFDQGHMDRLVEAGRGLADTEVEVRRAMLGPDTLATLVYTSGTTGNPKGCAISHGNFFAEVDNAVELLHPVFRANAKQKEKDRASTLLFLPMSHVFGRMVAIACVRGRVLLGHAPSMKPHHLLADLASFRPTFLLAIPYMLEKIYNSARAKSEAVGRAAFFDRVAETAVQYGEALDDRRNGRGSGPGTSLRAARAMYDPLVFRKMRNALGGRVRHVVCGGSPLGRRLAAFYEGAGIEIFEGYGLTETSGAATLSPPSRRSLGSVGRPMPGTGVRIAPDGEVLLRGPHVFRGYWDPGAGGVVPATEEGWLATGDLGRLNGDGHLTITGRKKEILITTGGKNVAPAPLENRLRSHPLISQAMVLGDARPYITALLTLDLDGMTHWRDMNGKHRSVPELIVDDHDLYAELQRAVDAANATVSRPESVRRFLVLPADFTEEEGHLTASMKLRRDRIMRDYAREVETLYAA